MGDEKRGTGGSLVQETEESLFRKNMSELPVAERPRTLFSPLLQKVAMGQTMKVAKKPFAFGLFSSDADAIENSAELGKMRHSRKLVEDARKDAARLKLIESVLRERQEMLSHHEGKVLLLKSDFEKKLSGLEDREKKIAEMEKAAREMERAAARGKNSHAHAARLISSLKEEEARLKKSRDAVLAEIRDAGLRLGRLKAEESRIASQLRDSAKSEAESAGKRLEEMARREKALDAELARKEKVVIEREKKLDSIILKINYSSRHLEMKEKALEEAAAKAKALTAALDESMKKLRHSEKRHHYLLAQLSDKSLKEAERLIQKSHEHLQKGEVLAAKSNYERIRELYTHLSSEKKFHIYKKIGALTKKMEAYWHLKEFSS